MDARPSMVSMVSMMKEKTITYLTCHSRGFEKVIWPIACIALLVMSIVLLAVACGTQNWMQLEVRNNASEQRGQITLGLLRGSHQIAYAESPIDVNTISSSYFLFDRLSLSYLIRFHAAFGLSMVAILVCLLNIAITLLNSYQSVTTWWKGPSMMYLLSFLASLCSLTAVGLFLDHYMWELDATQIFISSTQIDQENALTIGNLAFTSFEYLITTEGYNFIPGFQYSFYLEVAGACLPLLVTLLSWRLALLIPARKFGLEKRRHSNTKNYPLKETDSMQYFSAAAGKPAFNVSSFPPAPDDYEEDDPMTSSQSSIPISPQLQRDVLY